MRANMKDYACCASSNASSQNFNQTLPPLLSLLEPTTYRKSIDDSHLCSLAKPPHPYIRLCGHILVSADNFHGS